MEKPPRRDTVHLDIMRGIHHGGTESTERSTEERRPTGTLLSRAAVLAAPESRPGRRAGNRSRIARPGARGPEGPRPGWKPAPCMPPWPPCLRGEVVELSEPYTVRIAATAGRRSLRRSRPRGLERPRHLAERETPDFTGLMQ